MILDVIEKSGLVCEKVEVEEGMPTAYIMSVPRDAVMGGDLHFGAFHKEEEDCVRFNFLLGAESDNVEDTDKRELMLLLPVALVRWQKGNFPIPTAHLIEEETGELFISLFEEVYYRGEEDDDHLLWYMKRFAEGLQNLHDTITTNSVRGVQ